MINGSPQTLAIVNSRWKTRIRPMVHRSPSTSGSSASRVSFARRSISAESSPTRMNAYAVPWKYARSM